jgi:hypothetical protein
MMEMVYEKNGILKRMIYVGMDDVLEKVEDMWVKSGSIELYENGEMIGRW